MYYRLTNNDINNIDKNLNVSNNKSIHDNFIWFKNVNLSCRYDSFFDI